MKIALRWKQLYDLYIYFKDDICNKPICMISRNKEDTTWRCLLFERIVGGDTQMIIESGSLEDLKQKVDTGLKKLGYMLIEEHPELEILL